MADYDYSLPPGRVAHYPTERRDDSRLLVIPPDRSSFRHLRFRDLVELVRPGDVMVVNESRVLPARLLGRKPTGAPSEILLLRPLGAESEAPESAKSWEALVRPGGKLKPGRRVLISHELSVEVLDSTPGGGRVVRLDTPLTTAEALERYGHVPLPPYIERPDESLDRERYQTVYARVPGSIAAPTAGLHFTAGLLADLQELGVRRVAVDLQVGVGTFRPVEAADPAEHEMHSELYRVPVDTAEAVNAARREGRAVWAVGTTVVRTLESAAGEDGVVRAGPGSTSLFIHPPYRFRSVDRLITNFHLPRSTLLMLVASFAGYERTMEAYREAISTGYRFYSYGDAMAVMAAEGIG